MRARKMQTKTTTQQGKSDAVTCHNLHFAYSFKTILQDVNLAIPQGAVAGLIGANGCGKSTLLRCLVGLQIPQQGQVRLFNTPALEIDDTIRERLGFVAQAPDLFPWLTVEKHIKTIGQAYPKWRERRALELALRLRLPMGREVAQLSGGDQQKLAVVLALAHQPDLIILDEPVSSLDPMTRRDFMRSLFQDERSLFADAADENSASLEEENYAPTIIISSHLLSDLERVVSHVAFMREGRVQLFEAWDAVLEFIRILPKSVTVLPNSLCIAENREQIVVDLRTLNQYQREHPTSEINLDNIMAAPMINGLDELFIALNS
jgi:ABC-2 type transport system ATP-binding protein